MAVDMQWLIDGFNKSMQERNYPGRQQQPYTYIGSNRIQHKWVQYAPIEKFNAINLPVTESTARAFRNRDNSTQFPLSKRYEVAKYIPIENATLVTPPTQPTPQPSTTQSSVKPVVKSSTSNLVKLGGSKTFNLGLIAAGIASNHIPGSNNPIKPGLAKSIQEGFANLRNSAGVATGAGQVASIWSKNPWVLGATAAGAIVTAGAGIAEAGMGAIFGEKENDDKKTNGVVENTAIKSLDEPKKTTEPGVIDIPQGDDMTYSDILATSMLGRLDMKAPISNQTIASNLASLASMSRTESGLAFAVKRGEKVDFKDDYGKQMNMLLGYARTINDPNASEAEKDAATAAANVGTYGLDVYKHDADDMNKQAMRTEQIIKGYSKASSNMPQIQSIAKNIEKYDAMIFNATKEQSEALSSLTSKLANEKIPRKPSRQEEIGVTSPFDKAIAEAKKLKEDAMLEISRLQSERRTGTFQEYLNSIKSVKGQSGVKTYTPDWDKSKGEVFGKSDLDRIAKDLNLGPAQKTALAITIQEESGFNTGARNVNDGGKTSVGLYGMRDGRELGLVKYAQSIGVRPESKEAQIGYAKTELTDPSLWTGGEDSIKQFNNAKTTEEALTILTNKFIRPSSDNARSRIERFKNTTIN